MIPYLYAENETNFNHNGIGALHETINYEVTEVLNGEFELSIEYPVSGIWADEVQDFRIILAQPNDMDEPHLFRIYETVKDLSSQTIHAYASTKTNDLGNNLVTKVIADDATPQQVMNLMKNNLVEPTDYNFISDIQTVSSTLWERRSPLNCIAGEDGSLVDNWGGEIKRTNTTIYLYSRRGADNVAEIRQGKNLEGFTLTTSTKGMITRILPFFTFIPEGAETPTTITGDVVDSPLVSNYPITFITAVDYSSDTTIITLEQLNAEAQDYFSYRNPDCDKPSVKIDVNLMQLSDSAEYIKFKDLEHIGIGDTVTVWVEKFNVDVVVKITSVTYNGMKNQVTSLIAGTKATTMYNDIDKNYTDGLSDLKKYVNTVGNIVQNAANKKNVIFRGPLQPAESISHLHDIWYKPVGDGEVEMYSFDGAYWVLEAYSADALGGTVNFANVNAININADSISAGTLDLSLGITIGNSGDTTEHTASMSKYMHTDGSYTKISASGLQRYVAGINKSYHYLLHIVTFIYGESSNSPYWIQLPDEFKGKQFRTYFSIADSMTAPDYNYAIQRFVCTGHPDFLTDFVNARVPVIAYKSCTLLDGLEPVINEVQGVMFVIY